jgi:hypothetical protein
MAPGFRAFRNGTEVMLEHPQDPRDLIRIARLDESRETQNIRVTDQ